MAGSDVIAVDDVGLYKLEVTRTEPVPPVVCCIIGPICNKRVRLVGEPRPKKYFTGYAAST
jgi:hypothetical protein